MSNQNVLSKMVAELDQTQQAFLSILDEVDEDILYRDRPGEEYWTLAESLAHITEARQFWSGEVGKIQATPGAKVGRTLEDTGRLQAVEAHGHDSVETLRNRFVTSYEVVVKTLTGLTEEDLPLQGEHIRFGPLSLDAFIQRFIVEHDRAHVEQARALLGDEN